MTRFIAYADRVPKLWNATVEAHRSAVRDATLDATAAMILQRGLRSVTMTLIAEATGIGRATLYKYFPDVEAILTAWHERHVAGHVEHLAEIGSREGTPSQRLEAVLQAFAEVCHERHEDAELATLLHRGKHVLSAHRRLSSLIRELLAKGAKSGDLRSDLTPNELTAYCLHAVGAAGGLRTRASVRKLVAVTMQGLRPPR